ncbi:MAG: HzsA-related protein [Pirellulaceae bacterium]
MLPNIRPVCRILLWTLAWFLTIDSVACADELLLSEILSDQPANSLVRRLRETQLDGEASQSALSVERRYHRLPQAGGVVMESQLSNRSGAPVHLQRVILADWTFADKDFGSQGRYQPLTYRDDIWYGSTYWTGPDWTRVGKDWHHSGEQTSSIRRFDVPRDGKVVIQGRVFKADVNGGDGVHVEIRVGERVMWQADIEAADAVGVDPALTVDVRQGEAIRFVVRRRGDIGYDTTRWDPLITYEDGSTFQASSAFSTQRQGEGGWSYEMEVDSDRLKQAAWPVVHSLRPQLLFTQQAVGPTQPVEVPASDSLPVWVIANDLDDNGLVLCASAIEQCSLQCSILEEGVLGMRLVFDVPPASAVLAPGQSLELPACVLSPYQGSWLKGLQTLQHLLVCDPPIAPCASLRTAIATAARSAGIIPDLQANLEIDLCAMVQDDWARQDEIQDDAQSYAGASQQHLGRARALLTELQRAHPEASWQSAGAALSKLAEAMQQSDHDLGAWRMLYQQIRWLKRQIALDNPLLDFGPLMICKRVPTSYSHLVMQYYGWRARPGGGIFVLEQPGRSLACRDLLDGRLRHGNVLEPRLSYDGSRIVFSFVPCRSDGEAWDPAGIDNTVDEGFYHIWTARTDGTELLQVTAGPYDDLMPCWLPDGGIVFSSTRRRGYARCFGGQFSQRWHVYTLHRVNDDGTGMRLLSVHDTNEWFPTVLNTGHVLYSRWDYIDRDAVTHQNLWAMRPDGTNPMAVWGNATSSPHCAFQAQPIPDSQKIIFTASAHHSITAGSLAIVDPSIDDNGQTAVVRLTPEIPFPEAESMDIPQYYAAPWPLSEQYFLVAYSPTPLVWEPGANAHNALGIYLLDAWGNRELLYRDPEIGCTNPCPLTSRLAPPVISSTLPTEAPPTGEVFLADVYQGLGEVDRGTIKELRIIQILPKTTHVADSPRVGLAREENARAILGHVPVEPDGSAHFVLPAMKPVLFQALDEHGFAYQTMRTLTYVQAGERVACIGCHESRLTSPLNQTAIAFHRPASLIDPGPLGGRPFSFVEVVQPVLDKHCVRCHGPEKQDGQIDLSGTPRDGFSQSYWALCGDLDFWGPGTNPTNAATALVPRFGGRNQIQVTPPGGLYGARGSRLIKLLQAGHYDANLDPEELRRVAAWIDCNAIFYGVYLPEEQARQLRGEMLSMPDVQ